MKTGHWLLLSGSRKWHKHQKYFVYLICYVPTFKSCKMMHYYRIVKARCEEQYKKKSPRKSFFLSKLLDVIHTLSDIAKSSNAIRSHLSYKQLWIWSLLKKINNNKYIYIYSDCTFIVVVGGGLKNINIIV